MEDAFIRSEECALLGTKRPENHEEIVGATLTTGVMPEAA